jgi:hypothetical protein
MSRSFLILLFGAVIPVNGQACELDDCSLSDKLHQVHLASLAQPPNDQWSWMNHELAVARNALAHGRRAFALEIVHSLHAALEAQGKALVQARGSDAVLDLQDSLQELVHQADGIPLVQLRTGPDNEPS